MLGMGGCHHQQYNHNKSFVINRNGLLVFWRTVYLISRDLFKNTNGQVTYGEMKYSSKKWFIQLEHFCLLQTINFACIFGSDNHS